MKRSMSTGRLRLQLIEVARKRPFPAPSLSGAQGRLSGLLAQVGRQQPPRLDHAQGRARAASLVERVRRMSR